MKINDFKLEVFFGQHEFSAPYLLTQSDCEAMSIKELLSYEDDSTDQFLNSWLGYTEVPGDPKLRETIATLYTSMNDENIIVHAGAQEPIFNFMNVLLNEDDHVITQFPIYQSLFEVANAIGCEVAKWELEENHNQWIMDINKLKELIQPNTKLIVLNSPNNPTGYTFTKDQLLEIVAIAKEKDIYIFCDEVYKGIELDGEKRPWLADLYDKGVSLGVMSKAYGLPGLRIGWLALKDQDLINKLIKMKHYTSICSSAPSEQLSIIALKHGEQILERNVSIIKDNLLIAESFFNKYKDLFTFYKPIAGPVAYIKLNEKYNVETFCKDLIRKQGVLLLPASIYDQDCNFFRMGFGRKNFKDNLNQLDQYLEEHFRK